jgi:organic radical activating enzyme
MNYFELQPEENTFLNIVVDLTHRCNMECANCYIPNRDIPDLDKDRLEDFLSRLPFRTYIRLIGAEPTMRDDLPEIIAMVKRLGHRPSLTTNGLKLAHMPYTQSLKDAGLRLMLHSMNGADDDEAYKVLDMGKWAEVKTRALDNILACRLPINTGTIIARDVNEHCVRRQVEVFEKYCLKNDINLDTTAPYNRITPVLRMKSVGSLGRNMGSDLALGIEELAEIAAHEFSLNLDEVLNSRVSAGVVKAGNYGEALTSLMFPIHTAAGKLFVRLIDWSVNDEGVIDHDNPNRGRLTQDFKVAPFFEHVKRNEFGY